MKTQNPALVCSRQHFWTVLINEKGRMRRQWISSKHFKDIPEEVREGIHMDEEWYMWTYPDSSTTGTWSNPFSRRISTVLAQVTVGSTVRGAERLSSWMLMFHHLGKEWKTNPCKRRAQNPPFMHSGLQRLQGRVRTQTGSIKLQGPQVLFPISESRWSVRKLENQNIFSHFCAFYDYR